MKALATGSARLDPAPYRRITVCILALGAALRVVLAWVNPPLNSFDDHFEPTLLLLAQGSIPGKLACFSCYHPPVLYVLAAGVMKVALAVGASLPAALKVLQLTNALFGIATLGVLAAILGRLAISPYARAIALVFLAFLPRHLYMSALYSNDGLSYLGMAASAYLVLRILQGDVRVRTFAALAVVMTAAIFTKYTAFAVLPMALAAAAVLWLRGGPSRRRAGATALVVLVPAILLAGAMVSNQREYGRWLPDNRPLLDPTFTQPRDSPEGARFGSFTPWKFIEYPMLRPGQVSSFWTLLYAGMWFDTEPKFSTYFGQKQQWKAYYGWLRGQRPFPELALPRGFFALGSALESLGLAALALALSGAVVLVRELWRRGSAEAVTAVVPLGALLAFNLAGVVYLTVLMPVLAAMKSSYLLGSMPAGGALVAFGVDAWASSPWARTAVTVIAVAFAAVSAAHVLDVAWALLRP